jgi:hypothetical protein
MISGIGMGIDMGTTRLKESKYKEEKPENTPF